MFRRRRLAPLVGALVLTVLLTRCGATASSATDQVRAKVEQFGVAARDHDTRTICGQVLAPALLSDLAAAGVSCPHAIALGLGDVHGARLVIGSISVHGNHASVTTVTQAAGQSTALATLELVHVAAGWRIASLGNAVGS